MNEVTKLEDIEGFEDLSENEQEYFRVMQGEAEFRMCHHYRPGKFEIVLGIICWTLYIVFSVFSKCVDMITFYAVILLIADLIYILEV